MAQYAPPLLTAATPATPARKTSSNGSILHTSCVIVRFSPSKILSSKPLSTNTSLNPLRATPHWKYAYPDPIPEFAVSETEKFRAELLKKLSDDEDAFGDELQTVVGVCAEIFSEFLHKEYGGPGTLLVEPFTDMLVALKEKKLPGAALAARASLLWAQNYVDQDWEVWTSQPLK